MPLRDHRSLRAAHAARRDGRAGGRQGGRGASRTTSSPIICVGETAEDLEKHGPSAVPVAQLRAALADVTTAADIVVAYEPVWAIGSGQAATPEQAEQVARRSARCSSRSSVRTSPQDAHPLRRLGQVGQHRQLHARAERRRRPRRRREPRRRPSSRASCDTRSTSALTSAGWSPIACGYTGRGLPGRHPDVPRKVSRANSPGRPAGAAGHHQPPADPADPSAQGSRRRSVRHVRRRRHLQPRRLRRR